STQPEHVQVGVRRTERVLSRQQLWVQFHIRKSCLRNRGAHLGINTYRTEKERLVERKLAQEVGQSGKALMYGVGAVLTRNGYADDGHVKHLPSQPRAFPTAVEIDNRSHQPDCLQTLRLLHRRAGCPHPMPRTDQLRGDMGSHPSTTYDQYVHPVCRFSRTPLNR